MRGVPNILRSLGTGPRGNVYVSGYLSPPGMAVVDADAGEFTLLPGGQAEGFGVYDDELWIGTYPNAKIWRYDPSVPWEVGVNPSEVGRVEGANRPFAFASTGNRVVVGTVPVRGSLRGALAVIDPETESMEMHSGLVEDQTPIVLAEREGVIYGGTSIWGGLGSVPTTSEGQLFIFDPATGERVYQAVPVTGEAAVAGLAFDGGGTLWGLTENWLFSFDPRTRKVLQRKRLFDTDHDAHSTYWAGRGLAFHGGRLVVTSHNQVFEIDPATFRKTVVAEGGKGQGSIGDLAIDRNGNYYYTRGTHLWRYG